MHAENILALLNATSCERCGSAAVPGVTMCLACASVLPESSLQDDGCVGSDN